MDRMNEGQRDTKEEAEYEIINCCYNCDEFDYGAGEWPNACYEIIHGEHPPSPAGKCKHWK